MNITETVGKLGLQLIVREPTGQDKAFVVYNERGVPVGAADELRELVIWLHGYDEGQQSPRRDPAQAE